MDPAMASGLFDELAKIAEINLSGLSPQTILNMKSPEPLETVGSRKALELIDMADARKTASVLSPAISLRASQKVGQPVTKKPKKGPGVKEQIRGTLVGLKGALPPL